MFVMMTHRQCKRLNYLLDHQVNNKEYYGLVYSVVWKTGIPYMMYMGMVCMVT